MINIFKVLSISSLLFIIGAGCGSLDYSTNIFISKQDSGLKIDSTIMLNQLRSIDKTRIIRKLGSLNDFIMKKVEMAIKVSLGMSF